MPVDALRSHGQVGKPDLLSDRAKRYKALKSESERVWEQNDKVYRVLRVKNSSDFISHDYDLWAHASDVTLDFLRPGKSNYNRFIEAFNSRLRSDCLNAHWFRSLANAGEKLEVDTTQMTDRTALSDITS